MVKTRNPRLFRAVGRELPSTRLSHLYGLFKLWDEQLFANGQAAIARDFSFKDMFGKLESELSETMREIGRYRRAKDEHRPEFALRAADELGDMVNMAGLLVPYLVDDTSESYDDGHVPLERMILNIRAAMPDFRRVPVVSFDSSRVYTQERLFKIWIKEIEAIAQQQIIPLRDTISGSRKLSRVFKFNIREALHILEDWYKFDYEDHREFRNPDGVAIASLGDIIINGFIRLREIKEVRYEAFLEHMYEKLRKRDERYRTTVLRGRKSKR